ncbi:hypothetical protein VCUG_01995 [Vavraia culicis subsp. floridensis]|uniref:Uncharacterized protein n=1 Tax=Vavraia culicis (isolate floridensis) TaxID=948595 RepID=L2GT87_VAVCU|nr:uncharacterized protein VCUG_01995 [Vavraia culicis subsp. floridensis]ELA46503.1 hypothetical protein VCUG_01995 [Vavraia culicis subsp. floridensis]
MRECDEEKNLQDALIDIVEESNSTCESADEYMLYNTEYDDELGNANRMKVKEALAKLKEKKGDVYEICLSKNTILGDIVNYLNGRKMKGRVEKRGMEKKILEEKNCQVRVEVRSKVKICDDDNGKRIRAKDKEYFKTNFCGNWD